MIDRKDVTSVIEAELAGTDRFLVEVKVKPGNNISVVIDSDTRVSIDDCVALTRSVERAFNRDEEDYSLTVSSAGITEPYKLTRQYIKNIGREVEVTTTDGTVVKGKLVAADENEIQVHTTKKIKKEVQEELKSFPYSAIKQTKEIISFK